jgi:hypothetical protein
MAQRQIQGHFGVGSVGVLAPTANPTAAVNDATVGSLAWTISGTGGSASTTSASFVQTLTKLG